MRAANRANESRNASALELRVSRRRDSTLNPALALWSELPATVTNHIPANGAPTPSRQLAVAVPVRTVLEPISSSKMRYCSHYLWRLENLAYFEVIEYRLKVQTKWMVDMLENFSLTSRKTWGRAFAVLLAFSAPLSGLTQDVPAHNPDGLISISGTVERASADELAIKPRTGTDVMTVKLVQPFHLYARVLGDLSHIKDTNFVGVTSVKQPDGTERASAISILPEALRGVGEGSYMMNQSASSSRMTNGTASQSRMSNGSAKRTDASTLTVQYQGGIQKIRVPADTPVHEYQLTATKPIVGDKVFLWARKASDGSFFASAGILSRK